MSSPRPSRLQHTLPHLGAVGVRAQAAQREEGPAERRRRPVLLPGALLAARRVVPALLGADVLEEVLVEAEGDAVALVGDEGADAGEGDVEGAAGLDADAKPGGKLLDDLEVQGGISRLKNKGRGEKEGGRGGEE